MSRDWSRDRETKSNFKHTYFVDLSPVQIGEANEN